jgi:1-acyl-sn-glycerol-3-phosphate acyltransferase
MLPTCREFFGIFFGILYAGGIPVPIYPPARLAQIEEHLRRQAKILKNAEASLLVSVGAAQRATEALKALVPAIRTVLTTEDLLARRQTSNAPYPTPAATDIALLQYTSGSTGDPKGVILTHANILANIRAMGEAMGASSRDVLVSWLPLYHDMGLIGTWLSCLYYGAPFVVMSPLHFLARPERWLWTLHRTRATVSVGPNFAFEQCLAKIPEERLDGLDLRSVRLLVDGSEPVRPSTVRRFIERFAPYGFDAKAFAAGYGLAECAVGLTLPRAGQGPKFDRIEKAAFLSDGRADPAIDPDREALELLSCGPPLLGHEIRVVDETGRELAERREGRLQFRGPSATQGYRRNAAKTRALFDGSWLETGDLAYIAEGEAFLTGRTKDIILRAGRNIHPTEVEEAISGLQHVASGGVVLFGAEDRRSGTERLILMVETALVDETDRRALITQAEDLVQDLLDLPPDEVLLAPPHTIPRTASGKIRRLALQQNYEAGHPLGVRRAVSWQLTRLRISAAFASMRRMVRGWSELLYAFYWWAVMGFAIAVLWPAILLLPRLSWRWAMLQSAARPLLRLLGHRFTWDADAPPPRRNVVFVANHASYLDHVALLAVLRGPLSFAAYKGLERKPLEAAALKRLETLFVERFEAKGGIEDTNAALALARQGRALVLYPEATATRIPGLLDFRMGAFLVATKAGIPIVPIAIRGTRSILRHDGTWFPRRGAIHVHVGKPISPEGEDFQAALALKNAARQDILTHCGEPDLVAEKPRY